MIIRKNCIDMGWDADKIENSSGQISRYYNKINVLVNFFNVHTQLFWYFKNDIFFSPL